MCLALSMFVQTAALADSGPNALVKTTVAAGTPIAVKTPIASESLSTPTAVRADTAVPSGDATLPCPASQFPIANFERVNSVLLRGAVPSDKGLEALRDAGVKTIVNLRLKGDGASNEELKVKQLGMNYIHFPLGFTTPDTATIGRILRVITEKENQPVFVHCRQGADRTGMIVAIYRILVDNWEFKDAYAEMRKHHFKPFFLVLKEAVRTCQKQGELLAAVGVQRSDSNKRLVSSLESSPEAAGQ